MSPERDRFIYNSYVDKRNVIWLFPISALCVLWATGVAGISIYWVAMEDFGDNIAKQKTLLVLFSVLLTGLIYMCIGMYQMFFIELRRKFIARKLERWSDDVYRLRGYYFKQAEFPASAVTRVEEYHVNPRWFSKNIMTILSRHHTNYKVSLHDGREFYLPGGFDRINDLVALLKGPYVKRDGGIKK